MQYWGITLIGKRCLQIPSLIKAGVHLKAVLTSLNTAFLPISRSRFNLKEARKGWLISVMLTDQRNVMTVMTIGRN